MEQVKQKAKNVALCFSCFLIIGLLVGSTTTVFGIFLIQKTVCEQTSEVLGYTSKYAILGGCNYNYQQPAHDLPEPGRDCEVEGC